MIELIKKVLIPVFVFIVISIPLIAIAGSPRKITYEMALELAKQRSEKFLIEKEKLKQALLIRQKAWSSFLPVLSLQGTYTHADKEISFNDRMIQKQDSLSGNASASLTFFKGSAIPSVLEAYKTASSAKESTKWTLNELAFEVAKAYYAVLTAENLVNAAERSVELAQEHLKVATAHVEAGESLEIDKLRAKMEVLSAQNELLNAKNARESAEEYLAFLIGQKPPLLLEQPPQIDIPPMEEEDRIARAMETRADISALKFQVEAAKKAVLGAWLGFLPSFNLTANFKATENTGWSGDPYSWNLMLTMEWNIWDAGFTVISGYEKKYIYKQMQLKERELFKQVEMEVKQAKRNVENAESVLLVAEEKVEVARETRRMVLSRYETGLATSLELSEADDDLMKAEIDLILKQLDKSLAILELMKAIGFDPMGKEVKKL